MSIIAEDLPEDPERKPRLVGVELMEGIENRQLIDFVMSLIAPFACLARWMARSGMLFVIFLRSPL